MLHCIKYVRSARLAGWKCHTVQPPGLSGMLSLQLAAVLPCKICRPHHRQACCHSLAVHLGDCRANVQSFTLVCAAVLSTATVLSTACSSCWSAGLLAPVACWWVCYQTGCQLLVTGLLWLLVPVSGTSCWRRQHQLSRW